MDESPPFLVNGMCDGCVPKRNVLVTCAGGPVHACTVDTQL
jgi:hypothetical protein